MYYKHFRHFPNLKKPKTFNEKLQWLKLHDRQAKYTLMVDKYKVKQYVANIIGKEHIIPTLGVWAKAEDIDWTSLPNRFVLKCNNDSGSVVICKNKKELDIPKTIQFLNKRLKNNGYWYGREWPYKNVEPRIIAEKYIEDSTTKGLWDYKLFCFDGKVDNIMVVRDRAEGNPHFFHFDKDWNLCRFNRLTRSLPKDYKEQKPAMIDDMIRIAEKLSKGITHVRIDLFYADGRIYFGEYTLYHQSGFETGFDGFSDGYLGSLIKLPINHFD